MVRYTKLPFRLLLRSYDTDILYTPMMLAHEFVRSSFARDSDFTTHPAERLPTISPSGKSRDHALIAQFAASSPDDFARAAELISPWVDGVDLNCGCPQSWAIHEGIGCALMASPESVAEMVRAAKARLPSSKSVSVKIRLHPDLNETIRWLEIVQATDVDYITVHGRLRSQRSSTPPDFAAIRKLKAHIRVPMVTNGDVYTLASPSAPLSSSRPPSVKSVHQIAELTQADGVMSARGLLENPALFAGFEATPVECVQRFVGYAVQCPIPYPLVLHHVGEMTQFMEGRIRMGKEERKQLLACADLIELLDFVEAKWGLGEKVAMCSNSVP